MTWEMYIGQMAKGPEALKVVGMPQSHARAFMQVAASQSCVISSRELGVVGTGLVEEGYDSKGFRIKTKSCNFGPMAGFVCTNRNYGKKGVAYAQTQQHYIDDALKDPEKIGWRASVEHICISDERLAWLKGKPLNLPVTQLGLDADTLYGRVTDPAPVTYVLRRQPHAFTKERVWHLYSTEKDGELAKVLGNKASKFMAWDVLKGTLALKPIEAMVNPYPPYPRGHYKNCTSGDYDLFGVWPRRDKYDPTGEDRRIAGMVAGQGDAAFNARNAQIEKWEDKRLGNISNRVHLIAQLINSLLPAAPGAIGTRRDMVHHSDEAGRPKVTEVELPVIAFIPAAPGGWIGTAVAAQDLAEMGNLLALCDHLGYRVILNAGWLKQLGCFAQYGDTGDGRGWQTPHRLGNKTHPSRAQ